MLLLGLAAGLAVAGEVKKQDGSGASSGGHGSRIGPAVVSVLVIVAVVLLVSGLLHILVRCLRRRGRAREGAEGGADGVGGGGEESALQRQLQQLFHLHDAGLDQDVIDALPVFLYREVVGAGAGAKEPFDCAVCLCEFAGDDRLRLLPLCGHAFHIDCIDTWLHHNVSCPLCRTVVTGGVALPLARDDHEASCRELQLGDGRIIGDAARTGYGRSCRFPTKSGAAQEPITRSFSMDCFAGGLGRKPQKEPAGSSEAGPSSAAAASDRSSGSNVVADRGAGETSGRVRRLLSSFGLGRSSRSTVLPIHLDP